MSSPLLRLLRVAIDTNVFVEALSRTSPYHAIYRGLLQGKFLLCISNEVWLEYEEVLTRLHRPEVVEVFLKFLLESPFIWFVSPTFRFNLIQTDPDDNKFVDCAIAAGADLLITNDTDFNVLKQIPFPKVHLMMPDEFIKEYLSESGH